MNPFAAIKTFLIFWSCFFLSYIVITKAYGQALEMTGNTGILKTQPIKESKTQDELKCTAGYCQLDGSLFVDPVLGAKLFELPETSTPTARSNKALIWLQVEGTTQTIKVIFEDGTTKRLISNSTP